MYSRKASLAAKHALKPEAHTEPSIQVLTLEVPPLGKRVPSSTRPTLVYSSKEATITKPVQESESATSYEVNNSSSPEISPDISDLNLPIAVRKDTIHFLILCPIIDFHHLIEIFSPV